MNEKTLRKTLSEALLKPHAHTSFLDVTKNFPLTHINVRPPYTEYSFWGLLEHLRINQNDILEFCINPKYVYKKWPDDYWPKTDATPKMWNESKTAFQKDLKVFAKLITNPKNDLFTPFPWGEGQILLQEALTVIAHNGYHIGEFGILRGTMNLWGKVKH